MGEIRTVQPAKLFFGMLCSEQSLISECSSILSGKFGPVDVDSEAMPWEITDYYREELGSGILRKFIFLKELIHPGSLPGIKLFTNDIEKMFSISSPSGSRRRINIDPGYVTEAKVILATTKDYSHRVYIGENIYAEVTLRYCSKKRSFTSLDHTYFDFRSENYIRLFNSARAILREGSTSVRGRAPGLS